MGKTTTPPERWKSANLQARSTGLLVDPSFGSPSLHFSAVAPGASIGVSSCPSFEAMRGMFSSPATNLNKTCNRLSEYSRSPPTTGAFGSYPWQHSRRNSGASVKSLASRGPHTLHKCAIKAARGQGRDYNTVITNTLHIIIM